MGRKQPPPEPMRKGSLPPEKHTRIIEEEPKTLTEIVIDLQERVSLLERDMKRVLDSIEPKIDDIRKLLDLRTQIDGLEERMKRTVRVTDDDIKRIFKLKKKVQDSTLSDKADEALRKVKEGQKELQNILHKK